MKNPVQLARSIDLLRDSLNRWPWPRGFLLVPLALGLACFAFSPTVRAVNPPPDGGYAGANTAEGTNALFSLASGGLGNTAVGYKALYDNTSGDYNTATGRSALYNNTTGSYNTANGVNALFSNVTGQANTANGSHALYSNTTGDANTANGLQALYNNNTGTQNTANGLQALVFNTTGNFNTANGHQALFHNTTGDNNTASGYQALYNNNTGTQNTADGLHALVNNTTGNSNTAIGPNALFSNTTGDNNIALGVSAGADLTTGSNNIDIGHPGVAGESKHIRIGKAGTHNGTYIAGIYGTTVPNGVQVVAGSNGRLGTVVSSARFKEAIKPMDKASEAILALKPVTFRYKHELDPEGIAQFGLVAEEVEKVSPALVARDEKGKAYTVRYEAVNAMLLNEFLKAHRTIEEQNRKMQKQEQKTAEQEETVSHLAATVAEQQKSMEALTARLKEQASQIQKVSAELEVRTPSSQVALNQ